MKPNSAASPEPGLSDSGNEGSSSDEDVTELRLDGKIPKGRNSPTPKILKQRFVLDVRLGSGGMGTVYRAKDLRKVEARDRNPYVAVKVLNSDFRDHPDAFIALQREASKSQALSHPNIVSIYDFDKDGDTPFMTMELLQGQELAQLLKQYPNGLPENIAWPVIQGMCAGLKRAHDAGITHADFKPGNVFVTTEHQAKILDFGIARAVQAGTSGHLDDTHFDPLKLAALTPAYASLEMLQGESPEPRDDIYALGVCIYQILTGHHPYDRVPADQAEEEGLALVRCEGLTRRQWQILQSMLAFRRTGRPENMDLVIERLLGGSSLRAKLLSAALILALIIGGVSVVLDSTSLNEAKQTAARDALVSAQKQRIDELLAEPTFDSLWQERLQQEYRQLKEMPESTGQFETARKEILKSYANRLRTEQNFDQAMKLLTVAESYSPLEHFPAGEAILRQRLLGALDELLSDPQTNPEWVANVSTELHRFETLFPDSPLIGELQNESGEAYLSRLRQLLDESAESATTQAQQLYQAAQPLVFDYDAIEPLRRKLEQAKAELLERRQQEQQQQKVAAFQADLNELVESVSCQAVTLPPLLERLKALQAEWPDFATKTQDTLVQKVADCTRQVAEYDQDQALSLRNEAIRTFGNVPALQGLKIDPCAMRYLVGNGAQSGRSGFCRDALVLDAETTIPGPRLVVVPGLNSERFAIGKYETDGREFAIYCQATGTCTTSVTDTAPVVNIDIQQVRDYAAWLSLKTGYTYRLPVYAQWLRAAGAVDEGGTPVEEAALQQTLDPNRNCAISVAGVERGQQTVPVTSGLPNSFGLVNLVGNVREWVLRDSTLLAVGGSFKVPIADCSIHTWVPHDGRGDGETGFRLVREIP